MRQLFTVLLLFLLQACTSYEDRSISPETSFLNARKALHNKDLNTYFDSLTTKAVLTTLKNSISICSSSKLIEVQKYGYEESSGCDLILEKYGWKTPNVTPENINSAWQRELERIQKPREMVVELETNHREKGAGASFVWRYLDNVTIKNVNIAGNEATAEVDWSGESKVVSFEKDSTGWRFDPNI